MFWNTVVSEFYITQGHFFPLFVKFEKNSCIIFYPCQAPIVA